MYRNKKISFYFPCRNESDHLLDLVKRIPDFADEIIIISNCSTDNTVKEAKDLGLIVKEDNRHHRGIGYGYAHMSGLAIATGDIIVTADGDLSYPIEQSGRMIDYLIEKELDFISCNRYPKQPGVEIPLMLQVGVTILNWEFRILYGKKIQDILSGMWIINGKIKNQLDLSAGDWNLSPQIKINACLSKQIKFSEYSIAQYQRSGHTKQNYWHTGINHAWWLLKNRWKTNKLKIF